MKHLLISFLLILCCSQAFANPIKISDDLDHLDRASKELEALNPLITEAQHVSDRQQRFRFEYRCLVNDLSLIKQGLRSATNAVSKQQQGFNALCADYGSAGNTQEAKYIQMLVQELQSLKPLIGNAKTAKVLLSRVRINYAAIIGDIDTVIYALQRALFNSTDHKRTIPALRGSFSK